MDEDSWDFVIEVDPGNEVICDYCNGDFTDSTETGGMIVSSWAVCPRCEPATMVSLTGYGELHTIDSTCPDGMSFGDFVRASR
jgi:hypothetical protein